MLKSTIIKCFTLSLSFLFSLNLSAFVILIDPGHGGDDVGAKGTLYKKVGRKRIKSAIYEKDLTLAIAKRIYAQLDEKYSVFLTRSMDRTVSLEKRAEMAEKINADLFISIHMNSSRRSRSNGFETYYLDNHKDGAIKKVEDAENKHWKGDDLIVQKILTDLVIQKTVVFSKSLAQLVHAQVGTSVKKFKMRNRGIKPGLFFVLALSKRPGVLLEAGFLSNRRELKKLLSPKFQAAYATGVVRGIEKYMKKRKTKKNLVF